MKRKVEHRRAVSRAAFTLTELIVTVGIVLLLLSFLLPSVRTTRGTARRLQCANNVRGLGMAVLNLASSQGGKVPLLSAPGPGLASEIQVGWPMHLFEYLDRSDVIEHVREAKSTNGAIEAVRLALGQSFTSIQCPEDSQHFRQPGGLSYGANIGYGAWRGTREGVVAHYDCGTTDHSVAAIDWNHNGELDATDKQVARATGVFWFADEGSPQLTLDDIVKGDGTVSTILFAETMNLPLMHQAGPQKNGDNPRALDLGIGIGYDSLGLVPKAKPSLFVDHKGQASEEYRKYFSPNSNQGKATGRWPAVSSQHPGGANVVFADGHAGFISNEIHWAVWASLHTPQGMQHGEAGLSESEF